MIPLLPKWCLHGNRPTFYDCDAVTMLELASNLHGSMNTVIAEYNKLAEEVNSRLGDIEQNVIDITTQYVTGAIQAGEISIIESYDPETEALNFIITGGM